MGAWGTGLFDDDTTCDIRDSFIDYLDEGNTPEKATQLVLEEYMDEVDSEEDLEEMVRKKMVNQPPQHYTAATSFNHYINIYQHINLQQKSGSDRHGYYLLPTTLELFLPL